MKLRSISLVLLGGTLAMAGTAHAQSRGSIQLTNAATQAKTVVGKDGVKKTVMVPVGRVTPGTEVTYTITYRNIGDKPVDDVVVNDPVPAHMHYVAGSAEGASTAISYSIDGGKTWADALDKLKVADADGSTRAATAADCTNIRWVVNDQVKPGAKGDVSFRATLQ